MFGLTRASPEIGQKLIYAVSDRLLTIWINHFHCHTYFSVNPLCELFGKILDMTGYLLSISYLTSVNLNPFGDEFIASISFTTMASLVFPYGRDKSQG